MSTDWKEGLDYADPATAAAWDAYITDRPPDDEDLAPANGHAATNLDAWGEQKTGEVGAPDSTIDEFLNEDDPDYDWVVPGVIERGDRVIITGNEGGGKSTLIRQMAVQSAAGIHPFTGEPVAPIRVYYLDLENSKRHTRRQLRPLRQQARNEPSIATHLRVRVEPAGIDLLSPLYQDWLDKRLEANRPDLFLVGPLYKLASGDPTEEKVARTVALWLDTLRVRYQCALVIEAHTPHAPGGGRRPTRPYGASLWMRWPEFGIHLGDKGNVTHWRGARDERTWPALLTRGGDWPWTASSDPKAVTFARILEEQGKTSQRLSIRDLAVALSCPKNLVERAIANNRRQWDEVRGELATAPNDADEIT